MPVAVGGPSALADGALQRPEAARKAVTNVRKFVHPNAWPRVNSVHSVICMSGCGLGLINKVLQVDSCPAVSPSLNSFIWLRCLVEGHLLCGAAAVRWPAAQ